MRTKIVAAAVCAFAFSAPAVQALDLSNMDSAERSAFRAEVRAYLMDNPEVILEAVEALENRNAAAQAQSDQSLIHVNAADIFDDGFSYQGGNLDGDITLVEFTDYRCGYCRKAHDEVKKLVESDGNIRLIVKEFPILGEASLVSSRFAVATKQLAGDAAYVAVNDALIRLKSDPTETALLRLADTLGLDGPAILSHSESAEVTNVIRATRELAQRLKISGTPTFVMKDEMLRGYLPLANMQALVAQKRAE